MKMVRGRDSLRESLPPSASLRNRALLYLILRNSVMFVYYKLYKKPVLSHDLGQSPVIPGIEVVHETSRNVRQVCFLNEHPPSLLANQYLISQLLLSQPQLAPHKHANVVSPQYTLHLHLQHLTPQNQIAAVSVPRSGRKIPQRVLSNPETRH